MRTITHLKIQEEMVRSLDMKVNLQQVIGDALGAVFGTKEKKTEAAPPPQTVEGLAALVSSLGGKVG